MSARNGKIADVNLAASAALSGGTWALPLANLKDTLMIAKPARCAEIDDLAASQFTAVLERPRAINLIGLLFHTMSVDARIRITLKDAAGAVINTPEWADVLPRLYPSLSLDWEQENYWTGRPTPDDLDLYPRNFWMALSAPLITKTIIVELDDHGNENGAFDIGYLFIASSWSPAFNFERGRSLTLEKRDRVEDSLSGHQSGEYRRPRRVLDVNFSDLEENELMRFLDMGMRVGTIRPVLFIPDFEEKTRLYRDAFLATLETPPAAIFNFAGRHQSGLVLREILR
ncbi:MAG: hypothetical protein ACSHXY_09805 [Alphaproteobacteria bacterium]